MTRSGHYRAKSWIDPRVELRPSPIEGQGTFARKPIEDGERVFVWGGTVMTETDIRAGKARKGSVAEIGEGLYLASWLADPVSTDDFMNHSCDPNVWMEDEVTLVARRHIPAGSEIAADYAMWCADRHWVLHRPCNCRSTACRQTITGNDWRLESLQQTYAGHFSPYINEHIKMLRKARIG